MTRIVTLCMTVVLVAVIAAGCARAARDTSGYALTEQATVEAPLEETWQATKAVLRELEMDIYTRDKRGVFVAYSTMNRKLAVFTPERTKYTVTLAPVSGGVTEVNVEAVRQVYGVTLLTYPDWHDRQTTDASGAQAIVEGIRTKLS
jgi:hypothetical protein